MEIDKSKVFISYSRKDSEFAVRLSKDLKSNGVNVWLDQTDIAPGNIWDNEIEKALDSSGKFLVILTSDSVSSLSVMDELSYAIEENKEIIPVLLNECKIPFRIRRRQYIDFSKNYKEGLNVLFKSFSIKSKEIKSVDSGVNFSPPPQNIDPRFLMSEPMLLNLNKIGSGKFGKYRMSNSFMRELRQLRDFGYIQVESVQGIPKEGKNLSEYVRITQVGKSFLQYQKEFFDNNE